MKKIKCSCNFNITQLKEFSTYTVDRTVTFSMVLFCRFIVKLKSISFIKMETATEGYVSPVTVE
ncbi:hypothetical protein T02_2851 [Trichinella nativa]|uniref:Uncharacterized protein n=1 Tax=Trichinella nativa TaxID=6335 RepID=A0A0V1L1L1_9BILA|nr:hypothetical protein T02_2851 [Trichinella nativa]